MDTQTNAMMNCSLNGLSIGDFPSSVSVGTTIPNNTVWDYWTGIYYPKVITQSYPVYFQERAKDAGKQAFEIIKALQDKKLMKLDKVADFIEAMDTLIKTL